MTVFLTRDGLRIDVDRGTCYVWHPDGPRYRRGEVRRFASVALGRALRFLRYRRPCFEFALEDKP